MNWSHWIRQSHRWLALAFTAGFIVNAFVAMRGAEAAFWVYLLVLVPLFLLLPTGLYLFVLPLAVRWRRRGEV
ncbi:hypothetical protein [Chelativorans intermedius]|uniref:Transmembrane protein n=1 Tax=Chelativorans intermedius TaxID=515947 RepID=A0ABV6DAA6_9HYPH|nr:hypothetical protein [Chelativorans intermedius]MCT8998659.1 hypothetical protein [Chelativorans intermedius]